MMKVITERPRVRGRSGNQKHGGRLTRDQIDQEREDDTARGGFIPWSRGRNADPKGFSDLLGPLRRYLRKQVGRPWNVVHAELSARLDSRSLTGLHIWGHVSVEVQTGCWIGDNGRVYERRRWFGEPAVVSGLFVHPSTGLLCSARSTRRNRGTTRFQVFRDQLRAFGVEPRDAPNARRYRIDGLRLWERREAGWFLHVYREVPAWTEHRTFETLKRPIVVEHPARLERVSTRQAGRRDLSDCRSLIGSDPLEDRTRSQAR